MKKAHLLLFPLLMCVLTSCFHKDVMTDPADDVEASIMYTGKEGNFVICHEHVFQATSKSSGGGVTHISGYTETRLSSYRTATGELAGRVELGDMIDDGTTLLGYSPGKIWMFSISEDLGLHYRDPVTLEVKESWEGISKKPGLSSLKPAPPTWAQVGQYYAFNWELGKIMLTDVEGFRYYLDPETFAVEKTEKEIPRADWDEDASGSSGEFEDGETFYLSGDTRKVINYHEKKSSGDVSFLFGEWLLDNDPGKEGLRMRDAKSSLDQALKAKKDSLDAFAAAHPEATTQPDWSRWSSRQSDLYYAAEQMRRDIHSLEDERKNLDGSHHTILDYPLLTADKKSAYIRYASAINDTAHTVLAKVDFAADTSWTIAWTRHLPQLYYNPDKADDMGVFETVYSKGDPDFDYEWAGTDGKYLILVWQLRLTCVEMASGKIVWEKQI